MWLDWGRMDLYTQRTVVYEQGQKHAAIKDGEHYKKVNIRTTNSLLNYKLHAFSQRENTAQFQVCIQCITQYFNYLWNVLSVSEWK